MTTTAVDRSSPATPAAPAPPPERGGTFPLRWLAVLLTGGALFGSVLAVLVSTGDPIYLPCLLLLGAAVVPATFTTFFTEVEPTPALTLTRIVLASVVGGVMGAVLAGQLEFTTARALGSLPYLLIGLIEEAAKLAVPVLLFSWRRPRLRAAEGLVLGVAVGSGFAAMETMGYAFVDLVANGGHLQPVDHLLLIRAVASLGGHAAWTGLACAAYFAVRGAQHRWAGWLRLLATFAGVVCLHAVWDAGAGGLGYLSVAVTGLVLLTSTAWWLHRRPATGQS